VRATLTGVLPVQPEPHHHRPEASLCPRRHPSAAESALEVSNLPMPLFTSLLPSCPRNCSPERVCAWATPPCSEPSGAPVPALCPRLSLPCRPKRARAFPESPRPLSWSSSSSPAKPRRGVERRHRTQRPIILTLPAVGSRTSMRDLAVWI
jgi:hypothetical protein